MSKGLIAVIAALALLLIVQTWRVHAIKQQLSQTQASVHKLEQRAQDERTETLSSGPVSAFDPVGDVNLDRTDKNVATTQADSATAEARGADGAVASETQRGAGTTALAQTQSHDKRAAPTNQLPAKLRKSISQAASAFSDGDYETALKLLENAVKEFPQEAQAYATLAKMYNDLGMIDEAIKAYQDWTAARPDDAKAFLGAAGLYESLGMNDEALENLAQYERLKEGSPDSFAAAASMYRRLGMPEQELNALANWVDTAPASPQAHLALGEYYRRNADPASALTQYQLASTLAPGNVTAHSSMATAYQLLGQYDNAAAALTTAIALHPGDMALQMRLADVYRRGGDLNAAIATYQGVIHLEPNTPLALRASQQITRLQQQLTARAPKAG
ncbi:MAG: tetratricopeptide repeat protein [Candidatus Hydrogenedentes bacterium]|nr:tetratricopeptide repeat protein [Candidatus Hydrogenedentota bacterium]